MKVDDVGEGVEPGHLYISEHPTDIFEATSFPNPFENSPNRRLCRYGSGIIIAGLPGIGQWVPHRRYLLIDCITGKTVFLVVIFYLRVAAGLPTAYMQSASLILIYDGVYLFVLRKPALARVAIPPDAWILVDSNIHFMFPPREVAASNRFIIQASSPGQDRTAWAEKDLRGPYQFCLMRPWSLGELFAGYVSCD